MRTRAIAAIPVILIVILGASAVRAGTWDGTVKLGGIILDEKGDLSAVQETYNVYDGFSVTQIQWSGTPDSRNYLTLDLRDINLDSRRGDFVYRRPGIFKLTAGYDQHRQVFTPERGVNSERKDWKVGAQFTPVKWLSLSGRFGYLARDGDRASYPAGTMSVLGTRYDNSLKTGQLTAEARRGRRGAAVSYRISDYADQLNGAADRTGHVVSARLYGPVRFYDRWTHLVRGAYGIRKLSSSDIDYTMANFQYTGVIQPIEAFAFKYNFDAHRVDNESTRLKTDRFQNAFDATYYHKFGRVSGGYVYETNDDDRTLTSYHGWRAGTAVHFEKYVNASVDYAGRVKKDQEDLTLLKDIEAHQLRAKLQVQPVEQVIVGGAYSRRQRELPDIGVEVEGDAVSAFGRYTRSGWGALSGDYSFSADEYDDLVGRFDVENHVVTGRVEVDRIKNLRLAGGVTYMDIGRDLDIEKSMVFAEAAYTLRNDYHLEIKYNVYNYDDYVLLDRYYTANVVRINVAYDLHVR